MGGFGNFVDPAGVTRLRAKGGGGGSMPVSALPGMDNGLTVGMGLSGSFPFKWDVLYGSWDFDGPLAAIPAGLGLSFAFDGSDETITAGEAGFWAFTLGLGGGADTTLSGSLDLTQGGFTSQQVVPPGQGNGLVTAVVPMQPGDSIKPRLFVDVAPAASFTTYPYMQIVRLG